jgi:triacylglycerol lipase
MMTKLMKITAGLVLALMALAARADVLILVHGYLGSAHSWEASGINNVLAANGWQRAGVAVAGPQGIQLIPNGPGQAGNLVYSVELPSMAPMMLQADYLHGMLGQIASRHPGESMILAAHSAGGVVARLALVRKAVPNARALITIASPHLGTGRAIQALDAADTSFPFCLVENFFTGGATRMLKDSRGALVDLTPAQPGNLLFWLNQQAHPEMAYHSIVRTGPVGLGDELVPVFSQDMNNVPVLKGRSQVTAVASAHELNPQDGVLLVQLLSTL